ncbi:MAG: hypothetical protein JSU68_12475, partial [Phycisphaerales bacterium]
PNADFVALAAGSYHGVGLKADGSIVAWGYNAYGQCDVPAPNVHFVSLAAGSLHSLGLKADGAMVAWGNNYYGQCNVPARNADFVAVAGGGVSHDSHSLGLKTDGSIVAWGYNAYGQCDVPAPNTDFVALAGGGSHSLGLKADGSIVAWGAGQPGQTGYPHCGQCDLPEPNGGFVAVAAGGAHSLGLKADGSIVAWGYDAYGQCDVPSANAHFIGIAAGAFHSLGLKSDGSIVAWGEKTYGQCDVPAPNADFAALAGGQWYSLGLKADGSIVAWGDNDYGQCDVPAPNVDFVEVAAGRYHSLSLKADGSIVGWGYNSSGQCDVPDPNTGFAAVAAGAFHSVGIKGYPRRDVDIKPGSCPNSFNRKSHGVLPVALVGSDEFNVVEIDPGTVRLARADGVGGTVAPHEGPPGPHSVYEDVATPVDGETCDCHEAGADGLMDLSMKFKTDDVVANLQLDDLAPGALVELMVTGNLLDGTPFEATDCVRLVPPGTPPGQVVVQSSAPGVWIDADPLDLQLDGGGFADFERSYPLSTVLTLTAASSYQERQFVGWRLDGQFQSAEQGIEFTVAGDQHTVEAILLRPGDMDGDDRVDLSDFAVFAVCYGSAVSAPPPSCAPEQSAASDFDGDGDVDLADFATFAANHGT